MAETKEKTTKKDRECLHCAKFFGCKGKPLEVKNCVNFVQRK